MHGFTQVNRGLRELSAVFLPLSARTGPWGLGRVVGWLVHFLASGIIAVVLFYANRALDLETVLHSRWPTLHAYWLPLLFSLVYALCWLAYGLGWWLLRPERIAVDFADIKDAVDEATQALAKAGIDLRDVALYLVLGRPASGEANLFLAAGVDLVLPQTPAQPDAPLHLFASREAVFITCAESALLGHEAKHLGAPAQRLERLKYLCRLLVQQRQPYCAINGILLLVPWAATSEQALAFEAAEAMQRNINVVHQAVDVDCPHFVLVCDLESVPGFREFIVQLTDAERSGFLGQRFPLVPDVDPHEVQTVISQGIANLRDDVLREAICRRLQPEITRETAGRPTAALRANVQLYQLFAQLRHGCDSLAQIVLRGTRLELGGPPMIAGCYLAGTGADERREQAFVADVFQELLQNQNFVTWSPQALATEAAFRRRTRLGYLALGMLLAIVGWIGFVIARGGLLGA
jgi:type VI protein secretion system component VasK